jgi:transposase
VLGTFSITLQASLAARVGWVLSPSYPESHESRGTAALSTHMICGSKRCQRLAKVEGVGPLVATAMVSAVGNAAGFKSGRELSAWLGLVPR